MFVCFSFSSILILFSCAVRLRKGLAYVFVCWLQFLCLWDALVSVACVFRFVGWGRKELETTEQLTHNTKGDEETILKGQ